MAFLSTAVYAENDFYIPDYAQLDLFGQNIQDVIMSRPSIFPDVDDDELFQKIYLLHALGIVEVDKDMNFNPNSEISRAQMAALIIKAIDADTANLYLDGEKFYDVSKKHMYYSEIYLAESMGIISGYSDKTFRPENAVSFNECLAVILNAMGYGVYAKLKGDYPFGYLITDSELGVSRGVKIADPQALTKAEFARLLYSALNLPILKPSMYSDRGNQYSKQSGDTWLAEYFNTYKKTGRVTATKVTSLKNNTIPKDSVMVDDVVYFEGENSLNSFLGYEVQFYYRQNENDEKPEILSMRKYKSVAEITVKAEDVIAYANGCLTYNDGIRTREAVISPVNMIVQNGKRLTTYDSNIFDIKDGYIKLVSNTGNDVYDLIFIENYINIIVESISIMDGVLLLTPMFKLPAIEIDLSGKVMVDCFTTEGNIISFDSARTTYYDYDGVLQVSYLMPNIPVRSVVSIYSEVFEQKGKYNMPSSDSTYYKLIVNEQKINGTIEEVNTEDSVLKINNVNYKIAHSNYLGEDGINIEIGLGGIFFLDYNGYIAGVDVISSEGSYYGYLIDAKVGNGLSAPLEAKLLLTDGSINIYKTGQRITVNNQRVLPPAAIDILKVSANLTNGSVDRGLSQLIRFEKNSSDEITKIETILASVGKTADADESHLRRDVYQQSFEAKEAAKYALGTGSYVQNSGFRYMPPKVFFQVPEEPTGDDNDYGIFTIWVPNNSTKVVDLYDVSKYREPEVCVVYQPLTSVEIAYLAMVDKVSVKLNENMEAVDVITVCNGLVMETYEAKTSQVFKGLERGDLVQLYGLGKIVTHVDVVYKINALPDINTPPLQLNPRENVKIDFYEAYLSKDRYLIAYRGASNNDGTREYSKVIYWTLNTAAMPNGAVLYDATKDRVDIRVGTIFDIKEAYTYGSSASSKIVTVETYKDLKQIIIYNGLSQ